MSGRTAQILARWPAHMEPARPGKQLSAVVDALGRDLDLLSANLAGVRRSHRLAHAETLRDVLRLGGLHGLTGADFAILRLRAARAQETIVALEQAVAGHADAERDAHADALLDLWGVTGPSPRLALFAPRPAEGDPVDLDAAARRLARMARRQSGTAFVLEGTRARVGRLCRLHAAGNGTVRALLDGAASALDLELDASRNRAVKDASRPVAAVTPQGTAGTTSYAYVVVARSATRNVDRAGAAAMTTLGAAILDATNFNLVTWAPVPDARDYLVFRTASGGTPDTVGLLTPTPIEAATTTFSDTGAAAAGSLAPEIDDDLFHSADRFWHSSFVRDRAPLIRTLPAAPPLQTLPVRGRIALADLARGLGTDAAGVLAALAALAAAGEPVDVAIDPASAAGSPRGMSFDATGAGAIAATFGVAVVEPQRIAVGPTIVVSELTRLMGATPATVSQVMAAQGVTGVDEHGTLTFAEAARIAGALGFQAVAERVITVERVVTVAGLATALGMRQSRLLRELSLFGVTGAASDTVLDPGVAAGVARRSFTALEQTLPAGDELIGMEENPLRREESEKRRRRHAERFNVLRHGFGRAGVQVRVTGVGAMTVGPQVVNRDERHGIGFAGAVPDGVTLTFTEQGRVFLDATDVTALAFAWQGACFADADDDPLHPHDAVFDGAGVAPARRAVFAVATPAGALDSTFTFPHAGDPIPMPGIAVGRTRFAFFVQEADFSHRALTDPPGLVRPVPRPRVGFADGSVFGTIAAEHPEAAEVSLSWLEHEAYAVRVLLPSRFALLDGDGPTVAERVRAALQRLRPAGVDVRVEYLDPNWTLGVGELAAGAGPDPILSLRGGTDLWPPPGP